MTPSNDEYWYNTLTGAVEHGRLSSWNHLMGPYPTFEAAMAALTTAQQRTHAWDEADERWDDGGDDDSPGADEDHGAA